MQLDMGDVPGWTAFIISGVAVLVAIRANRHARNSADASKDSAGSARRSADAAERQAVAAEKALPPPPLPVEWKLQHVGRERYALRNAGTATATGVRIDMDRAPAVVLEDEDPVTVLPNASWSFLISPSLDQSHPRELWISWDAQREPVPVPVPPA
jgi:hypothetical protein